MAERGTKSAVVSCPGCEESLLIEAVTGKKAAEVSCWNCERMLTIPGSTLTPDTEII